MNPECEECGGVTERTDTRPGILATEGVYLCLDCGHVESRLDLEPDWEIEREDRDHWEYRPLRP